MRAEGFLESFVGKSSLCVDGCATPTPAASLAPFGAVLAGRCSPSLACTASPESVAEGVAVAICVSSGCTETVGKAFGSDGGAANRAATAGGLTATATSGPEDTPAVGCPAPADVGAKFADGGALPSEA